MALQSLDTTGSRGGEAASGDMDDSAPQGPRWGGDGEEAGRMNASLKGWMTEQSWDLKQREQRLARATTTALSLTAWENWSVSRSQDFELVGLLKFRLFYYSLWSLIPLMFMFTSWIIKYVCLLLILSFCRVLSHCSLWAHVLLWQVPRV